MQILFSKNFACVKKMTNMRYVYMYLPGQGAGSVLPLEADKEVPEVFEAGGTDSPAGLT